MRPDYDVIIIGGRPAGSTLAARLGKQGLRVLILERAEFPSLPAVSSPMINAATLELLDEIGADEAQYARGTPKIRRMVQVIGPGLALPFDLPDLNGRNYGYAVDRARFDAALWETALSYPSVEGRQNFAVTGLLVENGVVRGISGQGLDKQQVEITAAVTIGADGRFSLVARTMNAAERMRHDDHPTSILYAYWRGVIPFDEHGAVASAYGGAPGLGYLLMDSSDGTCGVVAEGRADLFDDPERAGEELYLHLLQQQPDVWARLKDAERVTTVRGMKRIGNLYRQPGGAGWALVGDAYMQQDPLDGQGIYNAVFSAKALSWAIRKWRAGDLSWDEALEWYDETVQIRTYSMYRQLLDRINASLYASMPEAVAQRLARWMAGDALFKDTFARFITRQIPAEAMRLMTPGLILRAAARGALRDTLGLFRR
jgi:flavin-dependent dehydrogenase